MKPLQLFSILFLLNLSCTPKKSRNNTHQEAPLYEESANIITKNLRSVEEVETLFIRLKPLVDSEEMPQIILAIKEMEPYLLNLENLKNPEIHFEGILSPSYRKLMDLYGYALSIGLSKKGKNNENFSNLLENYRKTIFSSCNADNHNCRMVAPFRGNYGVTILHYLLEKDIKKLEDQKKESNFNK